MTKENIVKNLKDIDNFIVKFYESLRETKRLTYKSISKCNRMLEECTDEEMKIRIGKTLRNLEEILYEDLNF